MNIKNYKLTLRSLLLKFAKEGNVSTQLGNEFQAPTHRWGKVTTWSIQIELCFTWLIGMTMS